MIEPIVEIDHLVKRYGSLTAVDNVSFQIMRGEIFALLGPNGAGKTTLIEILECLRSPSDGTAKVLGQSVTSSDGAREIRKGIGVLPQDFNGLDKLTVKENVDFFGAMNKKRISTQDLLKTLELEDKAKTRFENLSGGLKQRVGIAAALVNNPELVFLDEPTTGLDPKARRDVWKVIRGLKAMKKTVLLTSHYMEEAEVLADRIAIINRGKIAALGAPQELIETVSTSRRIVLRRGGEPVAELLRRRFSHVRVEEDGDVMVQLSSVAEVWEALKHLTDARVERDIDVVLPTIEDVFLKVVGAKITEEGELA